MLLHSLHACIHTFHLIDCVALAQETLLRQGVVSVLISWSVVVDHLFLQYIYMYVDERNSQSTSVHRKPLMPLSLPFIEASTICRERERATAIFICIYPPVN